MRPENWPQMLADYLRSASLTGFDWGRNDCVLFGANWVRELTALDPVLGLRGRWKTARGAARVIASEGGTLDALADARLSALGFAAVKPLMARRGDVVAAEIDGRMTIGIVADARAAFLTLDEDQPLAFFPLGRCVRAWRIEMPDAEGAA